MSASARGNQASNTTAILLTITSHSRLPIDVNLLCSGVLLIMEESLPDQSTACVQQVIGHGLRCFTTRIARVGHRVVELGNGFQPHI